MSLLSTVLRFMHVRNLKRVHGRKSVMDTSLICFVFEHKNYVFFFLKIFWQKCIFLVLLYFSFTKFLNFSFTKCIFLVLMYIFIDLSCLRWYFQNIETIYSTNLLLHIFVNAEYIYEIFSFHLLPFPVYPTWFFSIFCQVSLPFLSLCHGTPTTRITHMRNKTAT